MQFRKWVLFGVLISSASFAKSSGMADAWIKAGLEYQDLEGLINPTNCYSDAQIFRGCMAAIERLWQEQHPSAVLIPASSIRKPRTVVKDLGGVRLVELPNTLQLPKHPTPGQLLAAARAHFYSFNFEWEALYASTLVQHLPITQLLEDALKVAVAKVDERVVFAQAINTYLAVADDPHTRIMPTEALNEVINTGGEESFAGVGMVIQQVNHSIVIKTPIPGSPAHAAGVYAKDALLKVDGVRVDHLSVEATQKQIRGPVGSWVKLELKRKSRRFSVRVQRGTIHFANTESSIYQEGLHRFGYVKLREFSRSSCKEVIQAVFGVLKQDIEGITLDLRGNPGGLLEQAVCIADLFLPEGRVVVESRDLESTQGLVYKTRNPVALPIPLSILIDFNSASAAELLAGALQDHGVAIIVGERSFGKGTVQTSSSIESIPSVDLVQTTARFYRPSGSTNQVVGVTPDIEAFEEPGMKEEDRLAPREEDAFPGTLPATGPEWKHPDPTQLALWKECVAKSGTAQAKFKARQDQALPPDYPLLVSQDALRCFHLPERLHH